jgi:hypothetical protein
MKTLSGILALICAVGISNVSAQINVTVTQGEEGDLAATYDTADLIQGLIPAVLPGDLGWHEANQDPLDQLPAFTDGLGMRDTGLTGLLADYPGDGLPAKLIRYALPVPADIDEIRVFTGNNGRDGRVFHTYTVRFSSDGAQTFTDFIYVQSHASGTLNNNQNNQWRVVLSQLTEASGPLAREVTHIEFNFYAVDNTGGQMRDPFNGDNPFTGLNDGLTVPVASPLVWEIDVLGADSPPRLASGLAGGDIELTWLMRSGNPIVQSATQLDLPDWADLNPQPVIEANGFSKSTRIARSGSARYFRLRIE